MWLIKHIRHSRGYGVHSPLLYHIVRNAMMPRKVVGVDRRLYDALTQQGVAKRTATMLQNLYSLEGFGNWCIDRVAEACDELMIATTECNEQTLYEMAKTLGKRNGMLCIIHAPCNRARGVLRKRLIAEHHSMSAANRRLTLLFARKDLRKQHIII